MTFADVGMLAALALMALSAYMLGRANGRLGAIREVRQMVDDRVADLKERETLAEAEKQHALEALAQARAERESAAMLRADAIAQLSEAKRIRNVKGVP